MRKAVIDDCWGARWTVRARYDRHAPLDSDYNRRRREPGLRARLGPALGPQPGGLPNGDGPAWASSPDTDERRRADLAHSVRVVGGLGGLGFLLAAIGHGIGVLREPTDASWIVELRARGRIRRGATWRVGSGADAERALSTVAEAVHLGQVPQPAGTLLVDVLDERLTVHGAPR